MRPAPKLYVVYVRLHNRMTVVHSVSKNRRLARYHFGRAEMRPDCDQIWLVTYGRYRERISPRSEVRTLSSYEKSGRRAASARRRP